MALPKVGVQVVVQDVAKFTREMTGVESSITKMSKQIQGLAVSSLKQGFTGLAMGLTDIATAASAVAGPIGLVVAGVTILQRIFAAITAPIKKAWEAIKGFVSELGEKAWNTVKGFGKAIFDFFNILPELGDMVKRTLSIAFGVLVRDSIRAIGEAIKNMASEALLAASNFQLLEIRLRGLIMRDLMEGTDVTKTIFRPPTEEERLSLFKYTEALAGVGSELEATKKAYDESVQSTGQYSQTSLELGIKLRGLQDQMGSTQNAVKSLTLNSEGLIQTQKTTTEGALSVSEAFKEAGKQANDLLLWVAKMAIKSPFNTQDVANAFTMARGFGLTTQMAKDSTEAVLNFTAGMGLTGDQMERIIINFGQMWQQGKITGTELKDLAKGSLVPTTRIFEMLGDKVGKTAAEMRKLASKGKVSVKDFMDAFNEMALKDFPNAAYYMTRTFQGLMEMIKDTIQTSLGMFVLKPAMDVFTGSMADILGNILNNPKIFAVLEGLGKTLGKSMQLIMDAILPDDVGSITDTIITFLENLRDLIYSINSGDMGQIYDQLTKMGVPEWVINSIKSLLTAWENFKLFWDEIKEPLQQGITDILGALGINLEDSAIEKASGWLEDLSTYLSSNATTIAGQIEDITNKIERFIEIVKTGNVPGAMREEGVSETMAGQAEEGMLPEGTQIGQKINTSGLDAVALKIREIALSMAGFVDKLSPMLIEFGKVNVEILKSIAESISLIISSITGTPSDQISLIGTFLNIITAINQNNALIMWGIAHAIEAIMKALQGETGGEGGGGKGKIGTGSFASMLGQMEKDGLEFLAPGSGKIPKIIEAFTLDTETQFQNLDDNLVGRSIIPDMLSAIVTSFQNTFSLTGILFTAVTTFITSVIARFRAMWDEMTQNSIIPDMMEDIDDEMVGGFKSTVKQTSGVMDDFLRQMQGSANYAAGIPFQSGSSSSNVYNNYNVQVAANYANTQTPVTIKYDVEAAVAAMML